MSFEALDYTYNGKTIASTEKDPNRFSKNNIIKLKRKTIGFFKNSGKVSLEELSLALVESGIATSIDEGRKMAPELQNYDLSYPSGGGPNMGYGTANLKIRVLDKEFYSVEAFTIIGLR